MRSELSLASLVAASLILNFGCNMRARELQAEHFVDELTDIADDGRNDFMRRATERGEEFVAVVSAQNDQAPACSSRAYALPTRLAAR
jgi:hypothetical protein